MKIIALDASRDWPHNVVCAEVAPPPAPGPGQVLVAIEAFPVNPADLLVLHGRYGPRPAGADKAAADFPLQPIGAEGGGRVLATGPDVHDLKPGQRVVLLSRKNWVEQALVPRSDVVPVRQDLDRLQQAMLKVNPCSAHLLLHSEGVLSPGAWLIQSGANSALGRMVIRMARREGFRSVNVVRREDAAKVCREAGGDIALLDGPDLAQRVAGATGGASIVLGLDAVGGETTRRLGQCLADKAPLLVYGFLGADQVHLDTADLLFRGIRLKGFERSPLLPVEPSALAQLFESIAALVADGTAASEIEAVYDMADIHAAIEHASRDARRGKVLVRTPEFGR
ncbi:MAG: zinc-dependent alcohol dehydrogenase family protein [Burkholderiaceae bacterium]|nr:zinc-dependent alcohol dehydrogenase family protein [Burkholderiaceae bacterium]